MSEEATTNPWDRLPGESDEAWRAFEAYRDMGSARTIRAARLATAPEGAAEMGSIFAWSVKFEWKDRAAKYDVWRFAGRRTRDGLGAIQLWDRRPDETPDAFLAFSVYRDMGEKRTIRSAWLIHCPASTAVNGTWYNWCRKYEWVERTAAFDQWQRTIKKEYVQSLTNLESERIEENKRVHRDSECWLAQQAFERANDILSMPIVRNSFIQQVDGKTIVHKPTLITPAYYLAAAALMKAGSDMGRRGLGIVTEEESEITPEQFRRLFFKHTGEAAKEFPSGALPEAISEEETAAKPAFHIPDDPQQAAGDIAHGANGNGNGNASAQPTALAKYLPARARP